MEQISNHVQAEFSIFSIRINDYSGDNDRNRTPHRAGECTPGVALVGMECLCRARLGLKDACDRRIQNRKKVIDGPLGV